MLILQCLMNTPPNVQEFKSEEIDRDLRSRKQICEFSINKQDEIRQAYLKEGPYQPKNIDYPYNDDTHCRRFQPSWFESALPCKNSWLRPDYQYQKNLKNYKIKTTLSKNKKSHCTI